MKACHLTLVLLLVFAFAMVAGCASETEPAQESFVAVTSEMIKEPAITKDVVVVTSETTKGPVETKDQKVEKEPELVWGHKHENKIHSVATSGETVAVGEYKVTYIHHLSDGSLLNVLIHEHAVEDTEFSIDGTVLGAGQGYYGVLLSELKDNVEPQTLGSGHSSRLAFSPDGLYLATGNRDGVVWIWELDGLTQTAALENPDVADKAVTDRWLLALDYHPSGKLLAATHTDGTIYIWDIGKKEVIHSLQYSADVVASKTFRFSPNGSEMACAVKEGGEHLIRLITVDDGDAIRDIVVPERVMNLGFSPDGSLLAVASRQATTIWDAASGELIYTLNQTINPPDNTPIALTFTPDGGHLAVAHWDGTIELWRLPGAEPIAPPPVDMLMPPPLPGDVLFDTGSSELKQEAFVELEALAEELYASFTKATITFVGHTDSRGDAQSNLQLSIDRAQAIKDWFQDWADKKGYSEWILLVDGKGDTELKVPDVDVEGSFLNDAGALNRRVEIEIEP
jgi:WD40 repeat protein